MNSAQSHCLLDFFIQFFFLLEKVDCFSSPDLCSASSFGQDNAKHISKLFQDKVAKSTLKHWKLKGSSEIFCEFRSCCKSFEDLHLIVFVFWCTVKSEVRSTQRRKMATWAHPAVLLGKSSEQCCHSWCNLWIAHYALMCQAEMSLWLFFKSMKLSGVTLCDFTAWSQGLLFLWFSMVSWCLLRYPCCKETHYPDFFELFDRNEETQVTQIEIEWSTSKDLSEDSRTIPEKYWCKCSKRFVKIDQSVSSCYFSIFLK